MKFRFPTQSEIYIAVIFLLAIAVSAWFIIMNVNKSLVTVQIGVGFQWKLMAVHHMTLGVHNPLDDEFPLLLGAAVSPMPLIKDLWADSIISKISVDDQGQFGACTAHALSYAWQQSRLRSNKSWYKPSRCFWYAQSRLALGDRVLSSDKGSTIWSTAQALESNGVIAETLWPYTKQNIDRAPTNTINSQASLNKQSVRQVNFGLDVSKNIQILKTEINAGRIVMIGIMIYQSFMTNNVMRTGKIPMPKKREEALLGGHAIALSGWDEPNQVFTFRNSWGTSVGKQGSFSIPYTYVCNPTLAGDAWVVT